LRTVGKTAELEEKKAKWEGNGLTPNEWDSLSKNVTGEDDLVNPGWNDLSSTQNKFQLEHGAGYPCKLCKKVIKQILKDNFDITKAEGIRVGLVKTTAIQKIKCRM
jgi:hypothetical protein